MLSTIPVYAMLADELPPSVRKELDSICRKFLWAGSTTSSHGKCMVAWKTVCQPLGLGGLGTPNFKLTSIVLQTRWLWLQCTEEERGWSPLPLAMHKDVCTFLRASTLVEIGDGQRTLLWLDNLIAGKSIYNSPLPWRHSFLRITNGQLRWPICSHMVHGSTTSQGDSTLKPLWNNFKYGTQSHMFHSP